MKNFFALSVSTLVFISVSAVIGAGLALAMGQLTPVVSIVALIVGLIASFWSFKKCTEQIRSLDLGFEKLNVWSGALLLFCSLICLRAFGWLIFQKGQDLMVLSPNNLGDMSLHWLFIKNFSNGAHFWPENPYFSGAKLNYPFGVDFFTALFDSLGANLVNLFAVIGFVASGLTLLFLYHWAGWFAVAAFFLNGGILGFRFFDTLLFQDFQRDIAWKNLFLSVFVTQRGFLYAIPAGLLLLKCWFEKKGQHFVPKGVQIWLYATMPFFHLHTFLALSFFIAIKFLLEKNKRTEVLKFVGLSFVPATTIVLLLSDFFRGPQIIHWRWGWTVDSQNFISYLIINFGFWLPLFFILAWKLKNGEITRWWCSFIGFCLFMNLMVAPWEWDNIKILIWCYLIVLPDFKYFLYRHPKFLPVVTVLLFFSGTVSLVGGMAGQGYSIYKLKEVNAVEAALKPLDINATFAAFPTFNHPLFYAGRKLALGYGGHIWSHGLKAGEKEKLLSDLMGGSSNWEAAAQSLKVRYLFWGEREMKEYPHSLRPWLKSAKLLTSGFWGSIYDLGASP